MLVFIDESGDPGFAEGSSPLFVAVMVTFIDHDMAGRASQRIRSLLGSTHRRKEFKFNKCRDEVRDAFFQAVVEYPFAVRAIVVRKDIIRSDRLRGDNENFYRFFIKSMIKFDNRSLQAANIVVDGSGNRLFRQNLTKSLKRHAASGSIKSVAVRDSQAEPLLQLADMCVGAIARSYRSDRPNVSRWRSMIEPKIDDVWNFE